MDPNSVSVFAAIVLHLCPFTYHGELYATVPMSELSAIAGGAGNFPFQYTRNMSIIVKPTIEDCPADPGAPAAEKGSQE